MTPSPSVPRAALAAILPLLGVLPPAPVGAQSAAAGIRYGPPVRLPAAEEIALARSAAPAAVSADATVWVLDGLRWTPAVRGSGGAACWVSRSWEGSLEPHCFDAEGARTVFPIHRRTAEMGLAGATKAEIDAEIAAGLREGRYRRPSRPVVSWMLSSAQVLYDDDGNRVGAWKPHVMIYWPGLTKADLGATADGEALSAGAFLIDAGTPDACLILVAPGFVDPAPVPAGR